MKLDTVIDDIVESYQKHNDISKVDTIRQPDKTIIIDILERLQDIIFPGFFGRKGLKSDYVKYYLGDQIQIIYNDLKNQILLAFDYCENMFYQGITMKLNPIEQIEQLVAMIDKSADDTMTLNFKAGKLKAEIDDTRAIRFIVDAIKKYANEADIEILKHLSRRIKADESEILKESPFIAFFANMLLCFFNMQPQIRNKRKAGTKHSLKEMELVSFLIYFTRISTNDKWLDIENEYLKAYLKQYKDYNYPNNTNNVYPEFTT